MSEMNIKSASQAGINPTRTVKTSDGRQTENTQNMPSKSVDTVSLTSAATQLQSLQQVLVDVPAVDNQRVEALQAAIADGSYNVDAAELAQNMVNFETKLK